MRLQQGFVSGGTGFGHHFAQQQFATAEVGLGQTRSFGDVGSMSVLPESGRLATSPDIAVP